MGHTKILSSIPVFRKWTPGGGVASQRHHEVNHGEAVFVGEVLREVDTEGLLPGGLERSEKRGREAHAIMVSRIRAVV